MQFDKREAKSIIFKQGGQKLPKHVVEVGDEATLYHNGNPIIKVEISCISGNQMIGTIIKRFLYDPNMHPELGIGKEIRLLEENIFVISKRKPHNPKQERRNPMVDAGLANCFDASALLKLYVDEEGSKLVREYWAREATKFTTSLCFYEALTLLKVSHFYRKNLNQEQYRRATLDLCAWFGAVSKDVPELNFLSPEVFFAAQKTAERYHLDLSDAFQILSVKQGFFSRLSGESKTILITGDKALAKAAREEGLRVWSVLEEPAP